jgi:hypothetical protein
MLHQCSKESPICLVTLLVVLSMLSGVSARRVPMRTTLQCQSSMEIEGGGGG